MRRLNIAADCAVFHMYMLSSNPLGALMWSGFGSPLDEYRPGLGRIESGSGGPNGSKRAPGGTEPGGMLGGRFRRLKSPLNGSKIIPLLPDVGSKLKGSG